MICCEVERFRLIKDCLQRRIQSSSTCDFPIHCSESLFYFRAENNDSPRPRHLDVPSTSASKERRQTTSESLICIMSAL